MTSKFRGILNSIRVDGYIESSTQGRMVGTFTTMPAPSAELEGCTVLYQGTEAGYIKDTIYTCTAVDGQWQWVVAMASGSADVSVEEADRVLVSDADKKVISSGISTAKLLFLSDVNGSIQAQLNGKVPIARTINGKSLASDIALTAADVGALPTGTAIPTKVSDLENDKGYIIMSQVEDKGYILASTTELINYYLKTETYSKDEIDDMVSIRYRAEVLTSNELPSAGEAGVIYLLPVGTGQNNLYDEYMWIGDAWEKIGSTASTVDLSNYYTKEQVNSLLGDYVKTTTLSQYALKTDLEPYAKSEAVTTEIATAVGKLKILESSTKVDGAGAQIVMTATVPATATVVTDVYINGLRGTAGTDYTITNAGGTVTATTVATFAAGNYAELVVRYIGE